MFSTNFTHVNFTEHTFSKREFEEIIKVAQGLSLSDLKVNCCFYYLLYEKAEGNLLSKKRDWRLLDQSLVQRYSLSELARYKDSYDGRRKEDKYQHLSEEAYDLYLSSIQWFESMRLSHQECLIENTFLLAVILDVELTKQDAQWHPLTDYAMVLHHDCFSLKTS